MTTRTRANKQASKPVSEKLEQRTVTLTSPEIVGRFVTLRQTADRIVVTNQLQHDQAGAIRDDVKRQLKLAEAGYQDARKVMTKAIADHRQLEAEKCGPAKYFIEHVGQKILDWELEQDRIRDERQKQADDDARAQAQRDQDARVEELRRTADTAPTKAAATRIERQATALSKQPVQATSAEEVDPGYRRIAGTQRREPWTGHVRDVRQVFALLARGDLPETLVQFRQSVLNDLAKQYREQLKIRFPGLDATSEKTLAG